MKNSILPDMSDVLLLMSDIERRTNCPVHVLEMYRSVAPPPSPVVSKLIMVILSFCQTYCLEKHQERINAINDSSCVC